MGVLWLATVLTTSLVSLMVASSGMNRIGNHCANRVTPEKPVGNKVCGDDEVKCLEMVAAQAIRGGAV